MAACLLHSVSVARVKVTTLKPKHLAAFGAATRTRQSTLELILAGPTQSRAGISYRYSVNSFCTLCREVHVTWKATKTASGDV